MSWDYLPRDTAQIVSRHVDRCENLGLVLDRFNPWGRNGYQWDLQYGRDKYSSDRQRWLQDQTRRQFDRQLVNAHYARWEARVRARGATPLTLRTQANLLVGLGHQHVLETAVTLHRIYGFPIIPGSALKGLTRAFYLYSLAFDLGIPPIPLSEYWERKDQDRDTPLNQLDALLEQLPQEGEEVADEVRHAFQSLQQDPSLPDDANLKRLDLEGFRDQGTVKTFRGIFGSLDHAGWVVFFDAAPRGRVAMALDIMNPHYPQYYRGGDSSPHDADNPTPIQFLAVDRGVSFGFAVAPRQTAVKRQVQAAEIAKEGMTRALRQFGIGAKTTSGYGRFGRSRPITLQRGPEEPPIPSPTPKQRRPSRPEPSAGDESSSGSDRISKQAADFMKFLQQQSEEDD